MANIVNLNITSQASEFPYTKLFSLSMPLIEFKRRIELVCGVYMDDMRLSLLNAEGKFQGELKSEGSTLEELGIREDFTIKVEDTSGRLQNTLSGDVEHYRMDSERYKQRTNTFTEYLRKNVRSDLAVGRACVVESKKQAPRNGQIAYVGEVHFKPDETMVGVILDEPLGKHDGSIDGKRYFTCDAPYGVFVDHRLVKPTKVASRQTAKATPVQADNVQQTS